MKYQLLLMMILSIWGPKIRPDSPTQKLWENTLSQIEIQTENVRKGTQDFHQKLLQESSSIKREAERTGNRELLLWSHWIIKRMNASNQSTLEQLSWLNEPVPFPPVIEEMRTKYLTAFRSFVDNTLTLRTDLLPEKKEILEEHIRNLVRADEIENAVAARKLFSGFDEQAEVKNLRQSVKKYEKKFPEKSRAKNKKSKVPEYKTFFEKTNPAFQHFLKDCTAVSAGFYGVKKTGIRLEGHPDLIGKRGLNVVAVSGEELLIHETFDSYLSEEESNRFAKAIQKLPVGAMVVVAVADDGSRHLTASAKKSLGSLGAKNGSKGWEYRKPYLLIGIKGLKPGDAVEQTAFGETSWPEL